MVAIDSVNAAISGRQRAEEPLVAMLEGWARGAGLEARRLSVPGHADDLLITCPVEGGLATAGPVDGGLAAAGPVEGGVARAGPVDGAAVVASGSGRSSSDAARSPWLLFECHLDTVGIDGRIPEPFGGGIVDGRIHGRGACDAKGSAAAMLWALATYAAGVARPWNVALLLTVDEEVSRAGIDTFLLEHRGTIPGPIAGAVVGEPTRLRLVTAHTEVMRVTIRTDGRAAHSSDPSAGRSAISMMLPVLEALEGRYLPGLRASHPLTGPAVGSVNVIRGGSQVNIIAASCEIEIDRRTVPGEDGAQVLAEVESLLSDLRAGHPGLVVTTLDPIVHAPLDPAPGTGFASLVAAALAARGSDPTPAGVRFGTDAGALSAAGIPAVVLGPGDIAQAHTDDEWLDLSELDRAVELYLAIMRSGS
jgi:acetylornithine deacetylase